MLYLGLLAGSLSLNLWSNLAMNKKVKELGYIFKTVKEKSLVKDIITTIFLLIPYLNILLAGISAIITVIGLKNTDFLFKTLGSNLYSSKGVKYIYERNNVNEDVLRDALILDGADEETINSEIELVKEQKKGYEKINKDKPYLFTPRPDFDDKEYLWACTEEYAKLVIDALSLETELSDEQKEELLDLFRKECKAELQGKEKSGKRLMKKVLKITEN